MSEHLPLDGKRLVVTGGARGIGAGIVRLALRQGAEVVFSYNRSAERARELCAELCAAHPGQQCTALPAQVADTDSAARFAQAALEALGSVDALVNNAGVTRDGVFARMRREDWDEAVETNLGSMFTVTRPLVMALVRRRAGAIVNVTSSVGIHGAPGQANYAASKAGIIGFSKALAKELAELGVRVNAVAPGLIATDMTAGIPPERLEEIKKRIPGRQLGSVEDVAHLVCFLASDRARYITGQVIEVSGGLAH
ncbi:3-oxoacyl-ACP reductase FabG [Streptomyces longispororuber]|uniref:3-oxoacyl-ACP reductase FabG n=1 Tax=Streptomyces longispororuber TaxID=68230 RepID=UPI0033DEC67F